MKKYLLLTCMALMTCTIAFAGENIKNGQSHSTSGIAFSTDMMIDANPGVDQVLTRITSAFNGWQYVAVSTIDSANIIGGLTVKMTKDGGLNWTVVTSTSQPFFTYPAVDIVLAGNDTNNLTLYVAVAAYDFLNDESDLTVDAYDGASGALIGNNYTLNNAGEEIMSVAIASDYSVPANGATPYSVGLLYSSRSSTADSIIFIGSADGGATWDINNAVMSTQNYFRKVSLAYGVSATASNGLYLGAWEMLTSAANSTGNILTARTGGSISGAWTTPLQIDGTVPAQEGFLKNPVIAATNNAADNDSSSVTVLVLADYDVNGTGSDFNIVGLYNKKAHTGNYWFGFNLATGTDNEMQADLAFDSATYAFYGTYCNATTGSLDYIKTDANLAVPANWNMLYSQYNDVTTGLSNPYPQIAVNPVGSMAVFTWVQNDGLEEVAFYDAESATVSVAATPESIGELVLYPNPAVSDINVAVSLKSKSRILVNILNNLGQVVLAQDLGMLNAGISNHAINISTLANGNYFVRIQGDRFVKTEQLVVTKY